MEMGKPCYKKKSNKKPKMSRSRDLEIRRDGLLHKKGVRRMYGLCNNQQNARGLE